MTSHFSRHPRAIFGLGLLLGAMIAALADRTWILVEDEDVAHYRRVRDFVAQAFVGETSSQQMAEDALHGLAHGLDEYSRYYNSAETREIERETAGRYSGIGAVFRQPLSQARVLFTLSGSPAHRAGLEVGDRIVRIGERDPVELGDEGVRAALSESGPPELDLTVAGLSGTTKRVKVRRDTLVDPTVRHEHIVDEERGIGYLAITSFSHETPAEFDRVFERLRATGMHALIVDLRGNPGGVLNAAVRIAQRFVPSGILVSTEGRGEPVVHHANVAEAWFRNTPLVLLVDDASASASEVLAGALQDHRLAVVVGRLTYGKGMVQTIRHFDDPQSVVKVTTSYYYTPAHRNLEHSAEPRRRGGIEPDVAIVLSANEQRALHERLGRYSPPEESIAALRAWERAENITLIEPPPSDEQFAAALALLVGRRPGPHAGGDV